MHHSLTLIVTVVGIFHLLNMIKDKYCLDQCCSHSWKLLLVMSSSLRPSSLPWAGSFFAVLKVTCSMFFTPWCVMFIYCRQFFRKLACDHQSLMTSTSPFKSHALQGNGYMCLSVGYSLIWVTLILSSWHAPSLLPLPPSLFHSLCPSIPSSLPLSPVPSKVLMVHVTVYCWRLQWTLLLVSPSILVRTSEVKTHPMCKGNYVYSCSYSGVLHI